MFKNCNWCVGSNQMANHRSQVRNFSYNSNNDNTAVVGYATRHLYLAEICDHVAYTIAISLLTLLFFCSVALTSHVIFGLARFVVHTLLVVHSDTSHLSSASEYSDLLL
jgi:hypothetical protein